ncbi:plant self-incompatibility S1 [Artemisia annua]|uniref:S-protein homolog n=1 Tax=Artemisia annua TaxID=35608 RepID=A0A2U1KLR7_ARTAN|nr:plant self-incompatibility S1 [Artemisia annua]
MKTLLFLFLCLVFTTNASSIAKTATVSHGFCWTVYIYNVMIDAVTVHVKSADYDLGDHTLEFNDNENWSFCVNFWKTIVFYADFKCKGTKSVSFNVWDEFLGDDYGSGSTRSAERILVWLVKDDGFYVGKNLPPFPDGMTKLYDWSH